MMIRAAIGPRRRTVREHFACCERGRGVQRRWAILLPPPRSHCIPSLVFPPGAYEGFKHESVDYYFYYYYITDGISIGLLLSSLVDQVGYILNRSPG